MSRKNGVPDIIFGGFILVVVLWFTAVLIKAQIQALWGWPDWVFEATLILFLVVALILIIALLVKQIQKMRESGWF